jgi:NitT/TauT family transport system substrate-binding protein
MDARPPRRPDRPVPGPGPGGFLLMVGLALASAGCRERPASPTGAGPARVKVAYLGLTCEAAIFVAVEKGFFRAEGLDANYTLIMYLLKPIEQGLDVKITGGVHTGCLRVQAGAKTDLKTVADLRGKRIGIPTMGSPPFLFASRVLAAQGMDPKNDVDWVVIAPDVMGLALDQGRVDAVADSEPLGSILMAQKSARTIADQGADPAYRDEYCCATVVSGQFATRDPSAAAKVTRAMLKGARWVQENPTAAAKLSVERKYIAASAELNAQAIAKLKYLPGVARCRASLARVAEEMKAAGLLNPSTDPGALARRAWLDLDGVSDAWIKTLTVETIAGGGPPPPMAADTLAARIGGHKFSCCAGK